MSRLLYIYDASLYEPTHLDGGRGPPPAVNQVLWQQTGRRTDADDYLAINFNGNGAEWDDELKVGLDKLLSESKAFERVIFTAHGAPGQLKIGKNWVNRWDWKHFFGNGNYHKLFRGGTRWYFNGCNVADADNGTEFLAEVGKVFLRHGGVVFGDTTKGIMVDVETTAVASQFASVLVSPGAGVVTAIVGWVKKGHIFHRSGNETKYVFILPGGARGPVTVT